MSKRKDGGAAFPLASARAWQDKDASVGMSRRDYFAIHAFTARLQKLHDYTRDEMVEDAVQDADDLIEYLRK